MYTQTYKNQTLTWPPTTIVPVGKLTIWFTDNFKRRRISTFRRRCLVRNISMVREGGEGGERDSKVRDIIERRKTIVKFIIIPIADIYSLLQRCWLIHFVCQLKLSFFTLSEIEIFSMEWNSIYMKEKKCQYFAFGYWEIKFSRK